MRLLLTIAVLSLFLCSSAWAQGWTMFGEPLTKTLGGASSNGVACGVVPNFGSGWSEDMGSFSNCLNIDLISLPLNGVRVTWSQLTNCPTVEHFDRNLVYSMYWSPDNSTWTLINSQTNNTRASDWMTNDVPAPYRTNGYYTVTVRESDWTGGGAPAVADWYYVTNQISYTPADTNLSDGSENPVPWFRLFTNAGPLNLVYLGEAGVGLGVAWNLTSNSYGRNTFSFSVDPNNPTTLTNAAGCAWLIYPTIYVTASTVLGCWGSASVIYDTHELGHAPFFIGHADTVQRSGAEFINTVDGGDLLDAMNAYGGALQYNAFHLEKLGWLGAYGNRPIYYANHSGVFTITCTAESTAGAKAVKIPKDTIKVYSPAGTLGYYTNTFYYLETMSHYPGLGPAVVARYGSPLPYRSGSWNYSTYAPHSKKVINYGHSGGLIAGDSFSDNYHYREVRTGTSTNDTFTPFSVIVLGVTATNATIAVSF